MKYVLLFIGIVAIGLGLEWAGAWHDLAFYKYFAPKQENARREVYEHTDSYVSGKIDYISELRLEYESTKDDSHKEALRRMILSQAEGLDNDEIPRDLRVFIAELKEAQ